MPLGNREVSYPLTSHNIHKTFLCIKSRSTTKGKKISRRETLWQSEGDGEQYEMLWMLLAYKTLNFALSFIVCQ